MGKKLPFSFFFLPQQKIQHFQQSREVQQFHFVFFKNVVKKEGFFFSVFFCRLCCEEEACWSGCSSPWLP